MNVRKVAVVAIALLVFGGVAWYRCSPGASDQPRAATKAPPPGASAPRDPGQRADAPNVRKLASREAREQLLQAIRSAHQRRSAMKPATPTPAHAPAPQEPSLSATDDITRSDPDNDYIRDAMGGLLPMIVDCYKQARETQPALAGTLVVNFTIEGEPGIGGLVTESAIDPDESEIHDPGLGQCVQEAMFALEIDPPTNGGTVKVTYPFTFRPKT